MEGRNNRHSWLTQMEDQIVVLNPPRLAPGHQVCGIGFSPDDRHVVSASWGGTIRTWDAESGTPGLRLREERHITAFAAGTNLWAVGLEDNTIRVRISASGHQVTTLRNWRSSVSALALSLDGRRLAAGGSEGIAIWDTSTWEIVRTFTGHQKDVTGIALSADGGTLVSCAEDVRLWRTNDGSQVFRTATVDWPYLCAALSPDETTIAAGGAGLELWDVATGNRILHQRTRTDAVTFTADGRQMLTGGLSSNLRIWNCGTWKVDRTFEGEAQSLAVSRDGTLCAFGSGGRLSVLSLASMHALSRNYSIVGAAFGDNGTVISISSDGCLREWNTQGQELASAAVGNGSGIAVMAHGGIIAICDENRETTVVWERRSQRHIRTVPGDKAIFVPSTSCVFTAHRHRVLLTDIRTGEPEWSQCAGDSNVSCMALSPDSRILAVGCYDHRVYLLGLSDHQVISVFTGHALAVRALAFSPDGRFLVSSATDRTVRLWELEQMTVRRVMQLDSWAESLVFLNQRIVIAGTVEGALQLVDIEHGVLLRRYDMHDWCVHQLFVSPSGDLVCSCSHDGTARVWRHSVLLHACTGPPCV